MRKFSQYFCTAAFTFFSFPSALAAQGDTLQFGHKQANCSSNRFDMIGMLKEGRPLTKAEVIASNSIMSSSYFLKCKSNSQKVTLSMDVYIEGKYISADGIDSRYTRDIRMGDQDRRYGRLRGSGLDFEDLPFIKLRSKISSGGTRVESTEVYLGAVPRKYAEEFHGDFSIDRVEAALNSPEVRNLWEETIIKRKSQKEERDRIREIFSGGPLNLSEIMLAIYYGDWLQVEAAKKRLAKRSLDSSPLGVVAGAIPGVQTGVDSRVNDSRLEPLIAQYAMVKANYYGLCGGEGAYFQVSTQFLRIVKNRFGIEVSRTVESEGQRYFAVDRKFAKVVESSKATEEWAFSSPYLSELIGRLGGCNSNLVKRLEENMVAYISS